MYKLYTDIEPEQKEALSGYVKVAVWTSRRPVTDWSTTHA